MFILLNLATVLCKFAIAFMSKKIASMSSKDKENKSIQDKLKNIFRKAKEKGTTGNYKPREFILNEDIQKELCEDSPLSIRLKAIKDLSEVVTNNQLEERAVEKLCHYTSDLLTNPSADVRHATFLFLHCLVKGQSERLGILRSHFFRIIKQCNEDVPQRFELLQILTNNGKEILYFEEEVGPFLLSWFPDITRAGKVEDFLCLLVNIIKFNAAYIEEDVVTGLVQHICLLCCNTNQQSVVMACLQIFDTIVAYSNLPPESLPQFIGALCRTVNGEVYCQTSWKIMRNLLGTHLGHSTLLTMCSILRETALKEDVSLLRGAIFYISMALWGKQPVPNLKCPPSAVLPSILQVVKNFQPIVTYEVILNVQALVNKHGLDLQYPAWDTILDILFVIIQQVDSEPLRKPNPLVATHLHETLNTIESLVELGSFNGSIEQFFKIIEECFRTRPENSVLRLVGYLAKSIVPTKHLWLTNLYNLLHRYFKQEVRTNIRIKVLEILSNVVNLNRMLYEEELIERIVIPYLINIVNDPDVVVRSYSAKLLIDLCMECDSKRCLCLEMLDILEKLLNRPFEVHTGDNQLIDETEIFDVKTVVNGLIQVFTVKIHKLPSLHAIRIYKMLVKFLDLHYNRPKLFENCSQIRYKIFDCFLKMRADHMYHLGCPDPSGKLKFSSYLCVIYSSDKGPMNSPPPASPAIQQPPCTISYVSLKYAFQVVITCLKVEKDRDVLNLLLQEIPHVLQNKSLILSKQGNSEVHLLVDALCNMITDKSSMLETAKLRADYIASILLVLSNLASYHAYLAHSHQQKMIWHLYKYGLGPKSSKQCITALTTCTLEMREVMVKKLPEVLLNLSKISATVHIAIPVLEFLSTLTVLPMVFANFVADQYMAVFAISLPYTNPFKYNHYIVSLAHHVIAVWFLKCRLPFRKDFVRFITNGLQTNALIPFEETIKTDLSKLNQDSSDRKRSSSLTEQSSRRPAARSVTVGRRKPPVLTFYEELTETCVDLMARYAFSPCSVLPRRLPTAEFLLSGGQSMSWLLGNKVITVTTSGCSQKALKYGLCDKCYVSCKTDSTKTPDERLLKTTRSGSTEKEKDDSSNRVTRQNSGDKSNTNTSTSSPIEENKKLSDKLDQLPMKLQQLTVGDSNTNEKQRCACWCQGWAEIYVRRPTGDMSWVIRIQNQTSCDNSIYEFPLNEMSTLFMPSLSHHTNYDYDNYDNQFYSHDDNQEDECNTTSVPISIPGSPSKHSPSRQSSRDSIDEDLEHIYEDGTKSRNPVRRSNSSPEMSANWKNPFMQQKQEREDVRSQDDDCVKKIKNYSKDMRVSCEAIPEEIAGTGTTPPTEMTQHQHPSLLSSLSYPGTTPPQDIIPRPYQTVPPSPSPAVNQNPLPSSTTSATAGHALRSSAGILRSSKSESTESMGSEKSSERPTTLPALSNLTPLITKPPQSPTQTSPRLPRHSINRDKEGHEIQKSSSVILEKSSSLSSQYPKSLKDKKSDTEKLSQSSQNLSSQKRDRCNTISVMSPVRKPHLEFLRHSHISRSKEAPKSGISPSFVFLQLYHAAHYENITEKPLLVDSSDAVQRALKVLDCIPPYETHKVGVIYIGQGQCNNETEILRNKYGSGRYVEFLQKLGTLIKLSDADPQVLFLGGLEQNGCDGKFSYIWQDDVIRVMFHVATLMPNKENDPNCNDKKRHIGNNNVTIVYNESGEDYNINTLKGQFNFASVIIQPLDHNTNKVMVKAKEELVDLIGNSEPKIVSDQNVAILARQLALHTNLASLVSTSLKSRNRDAYASNWLERLRKIKNLRSKILQESRKEQDDVSAQVRRGQMEDFTEYT